MDFLVNDLSLDGQFHDLAKFVEAISRIMDMQKTARRFGSELYCHRNISGSNVLPGVPMEQAINKLSRDQRLVILRWLCNQGPSWDDARKHGSEDYFECKGDVVTNTALGEAAYRCKHGAEHHLVSFTGLGWEYTPVNVRWHLDDADVREIDVCNHWEQHSLEKALENAPVRAKTWSQLGAAAMARFTSIRFSADCFVPLDGEGFAIGAATQINKLLHVLNQYQTILDENGRNAPEINILRQEHFIGGRSWFSDSSESEKNTFRKELTFRHPDQPDKTLFCPRHGKVNGPQKKRIHFSWPARAGKPLYVVHVGPKITKK